MGRCSLLYTCPGINVILPLLFLNSEPKENRFVRFHALQSLLLTGSVLVVGFTATVITRIIAVIPFLSFISMLNDLMGVVICLVLVVVNVFLISEAHQGRMTRLPIIGEMVEHNV